MRREGCQNFLWFFIARYIFLPSFFKFHLVGIQFHVLLLLENAIDDGAQKLVEVLHPSHLPAPNNIVVVIKNELCSFHSFVTPKLHMMQLP